MEQELQQEPHPDYLKGFNEGYLIQEQMPQLADILAKSMDSIDSERAIGFKDGREQLLNELGMDKSKEHEAGKDLKVTWMEPLPEDDYNDKGHDLDTNKDDFDIEIE